ncbi:MAG: general secretion pathway protein GspK [Rhodobacterales bacterium]|nr:general secretion pathway protein GspK [Rhodobacterales bacterium]
MSARPPAAPLPTGNGKRRGFALVVVLWMLIILSTTALTLSTELRVETRAAVNAQELARAGALADAGVYRGIAALLDTSLNPDERWTPDGRVYEETFDDQVLKISLQDENGKIDLNAADPLLLRQLLLARDMESQAADRLVDHILDWKDEDDLRRLNGGEAPDYEAEGLAVLPANRPFLAVDELRTVAGMTEPLFRALAPALTVYSGKPGVNPQTAPRLALMSLPGADPAEVDAILQARSASADVLGVAVPTLGGDAVTGELGPVYTVRCQVEMPSGLVFAREAVVWVASAAVRPYWILDWRRGAVATDDDQESSADSSSGKVN